MRINADDEVNAGDAMHSGCAYDYGQVDDVPAGDGWTLLAVGLSTPAPWMSPVMSVVGEWTTMVNHPKATTSISGQSRFHLWSDHGR